MAEIQTAKQFVIAQTAFRSASKLAPFYVFVAVSRIRKQMFDAFLALIVELVPSDRISWTVLFLYMIRPVFRSVMSGVMMPKDWIMRVVDVVPMREGPQSHRHFLTLEVKGLVIWDFMDET